MPLLEPTVGISRACEHKAALIGQRLHPQRHGKGGALRIHTAGRIPQHRITGAQKRAPRGLVQQIRQPAQFYLKLPRVMGNLAHLPAKPQLPRAHVIPAHQPIAHFGPVIAPSANIFRRDDIRLQQPHRLGIIHRQARACRQRPRAEPAIRQKGDPIERKRPVVIGKAKGHAVIPRDRPALAHMARACAQMRKQSRLAHTRTSTTGTLGACPA